LVPSSVGFSSDPPAIEFKGGTIGGDCTGGVSSICDHRDIKLQSGVASMLSRTRTVAKATEARPSLSARSKNAFVS